MASLSLEPGAEAMKASGGAQRRMRAVVLCSRSFLGSGPKVGMQFIAEGLAQAGWEVHYISAGSSPFDVISRSRRRRMTQAWLRSGACRPVRVQERLWEYVFRSPLPVDRRALRYDWQLAAYRSMAPGWLAREHFDLCVHDSSPALIYRSMVHATHHVVRLSDVIEGFAHPGLPVIHEFQRGLRDGVYSMGWAVSSGLVGYAQKIRPDLPVLVIPNGVESVRFQEAASGARLPDSAVFIGSEGAWLDMPLMAAAARRLPHWRFNVYGPIGRRRCIAPDNVTYNGSVAYGQVPELLNRHQVGLIPFREAGEHLAVCERPLKFYQYLAAGLGVAASDVGRLRQGMAPWACFGNDADSFAAAIPKSRKEAQTRDAASVRHYLAKQSWKTRMQEVMSALMSLYPSLQPTVQAVQF